MKAWQIGGIILGLSALAMLAMPSEARDSLGESWRRLTRDAGQACFDYQRTLLKDPYSARLDGYSVSRFDVTITYHAKNSYGAYIGGVALCTVIDGKVAEESTQLSRDNVATDQRIRKLEAEAECLEKKNTMMLSGKSSAEADKKMGACSTE